jgi:2-methylcitrate dehydratase PrpD
VERDARTAYFLADLTHQIRFESLPPAVLEKAAELILDSIGCMIGGTHTEQGQKIIDIFGGMQGIEEASVYGASRRLPLLNAVYTNAYTATTLDMDDTYDGHPGSTVIPVALSLGEALDVDGKKFLEAVVAGYEVGIRISNGIKPTPERTAKVRGINTWQIFCAAATAAKLLDLDREQTAHAYGHAAIHASVPSLRKWGFVDGKIQWLKNNFGYTCYGGVLSAILAQKGFVADTTIFDGEDGFWIMASSDQCDYDAIRTPADTFFIHKVHTKPYAACRHIHPTLDAVAAIVQEHRITPEQIERIRVETFYEVVNDYTALPSQPFDVVFSAPFLVALMAHQVPPGPGWFKPERLRDESLLQTANKVHFEEWAEASRLYPLVNRELMSKVTVTTVSGEALFQEVRIPKGDPRNPMSPEESSAKFHTLAAPVIGAIQSGKIESQVRQGLQGVSKIRELTSLMVTQNGW